MINNKYIASKINPDICPSNSNIMHCIVNMIHGIDAHTNLKTAFIIKPFRRLCFAATKPVIHNTIVMIHNTKKNIKIPIAKYAAISTNAPANFAQLSFCSLIEFVIAIDTTNSKRLNRHRNDIPILSCIYSTLDILQYFVLNLKKSIF